MGDVIFTRTTSAITYKVGRTLTRKNARRHLAAKIYARDEKEAIDKFIELVSGFTDTDIARYELYTGNWQLVYIFN